MVNNKILYYEKKNKKKTINKRICEGWKKGIVRDQQIIFFSLLELKQLSIHYLIIIYNLVHIIFNRKKIAVHFSSFFGSSDFVFILFFLPNNIEVNSHNICLPSEKVHMEKSWVWEFIFLSHKHTQRYNNYIYIDIYVIIFCIKNVGTGTKTWTTDTTPSFLPLFPQITIPTDEPGQKA